MPTASKKTTIRGRKGMSGDGYTRPERIDESCANQH